MNTITIELCGEDRARLDRILAALEGLNTRPEKSLAEIMADFIATPAGETTQEAPAEPVKEPEVLAEPEKPKATKADVQALVQKLATPTSGKRDEVKRIVNEYAPRVSGIPEDKLDEVMQRLIALGGENA